jgi:hypothetical protein
MEWLNWKQAKEKWGTLLKKVEEFWRSKKETHFRCVKRIAFGGSHAEKKSIQELRVQRTAAQSFGRTGRYSGGEYHERSGTGCVGAGRRPGRLHWEELPGMARGWLGQPV